VKYIKKDERITVDK